MPEQVCIVSDFPPVRDGATATSSVAWNLVKSLEVHCGLILSRRHHKHVVPDSIGAGIKAECHLFTDAHKIGLRGVSEDLRAVIDSLALIVQLPRISAKVHATGCKRIFMIGANHWSCIAFAYLLGRATRLPTDLFLMDDLEASAEMQGRSIKAQLARWAERAWLPKFRRVWTISQGYAEHLQQKYQVSAKLLPLVIRQPLAHYQPYVCDERVIGYTGGLHGLYAEPLKELVKEIQRRNARPGPRYSLRIFRFSCPPGSLDFLDGEDVIETVLNLDNQRLVQALGECFANFLPYSFADEFRVMVSTSFSSKSAEYLACGRPIMVYGPDYASVPRHFREAGLPLVETRSGHVGKLLDAIEDADGPHLIDAYNRLMEEFHTPKAVRGVLNQDWEHDSEITLPDPI